MLNTKIKYPFYMATKTKEKHTMAYIKVTKNDIFYLEIKKTQNGNIKKVKLETRMVQVVPVFQKNLFSFVYRNIIFYSDTDTITELEFNAVLVEFDIYRTACLYANNIPFYVSRKNTMYQKYEETNLESI